MMNAGDKIETTAYAVVNDAAEGEMVVAGLFEEYWQAARFTEKNEGRIWETKVTVELLQTA